jgi:hypothetical protein
MAGMARKYLAPVSFRSTRRCSRICALTLSILALALAAPSVSAGIGYCKVDPAVVIDGQLADIFIGVPFDDLGKVNGPTEVVVSTPVGVGDKLAIATAGFGYGEIVSFAESPSLQVTSQGIEVRIKVRVPANSDAMPVLVEFAPDVVGVLHPTKAEGNANHWVSLKAVL